MWTDERVADLRRLWADGLSAGQIAGRLGGVTRNSVTGKLWRLGLSAPLSAQRHRAPRPSTLRAKAAALDRAAGLLPSKPWTFSAATAPAPVIASPAAPDVARVASVLDLEHNHCRWPVGDPLQGFCGADRVVIGGKLKPYCACHHARAQTAAAPRSATRQDYTHPAVRIFA